MTVVRAAGGVVWRRAGGRVEVVVVHRPHRDDWTLPKGKAKRGESDEACALREVEEETSLRCRLGPELGATEYVDTAGAAKRVRWWAMRPVAGTLRGADEVDEARWVEAGAARALLSYPRDRALVEALLALPGLSGARGSAAAPAPAPGA